MHRKKVQLKRAERDVEHKNKSTRRKLRFQTLRTKILGWAHYLRELKVPNCQLLPFKGDKHWCGALFRFPRCKFRRQLQTQCSCPLTSPPLSRFAPAGAARIFHAVVPLAPAWRSGGKREDLPLFIFQNQLTAI